MNDLVIPSIREPELRALFEELRDEEVHHQDLIRRELAKLPADSTIDPEDFTDGPMAQ
jgi:rubrerythrin